jgi:DeoR family transcriptional regulator, aga operon transcriptional repressor
LLDSNCRKKYDARKHGKSGMSVSNDARREKIREHITRRQEASVRGLCQEFGASEATIRRDILILSREPGFRKTRGGIELDAPQSELSVLQRGHLLAERKRLIGARAAELVRDGETVFLGSGSTTIEVARRLGEKSNLTVITNSLPIITTLADNPRVALVIAGGTLRRPELSFIGHIVQATLSELRADRVIMGIQGIHPEHGLTNEFQPEAILDRFLVHFAPRLCVVADSSKLGRITASFVGDLADVGDLVTDAEENGDVREEIRRRGVRVTVAGETA